MRVVFHIITHLDLGGGERVAINIAKNGGPEYEHHIVCVRGARGEFYEALSKELKDAGVLVHQGPFVGNKLGIILFPVWFFFVVIKWKPVVIHSHTEVPDLSVFLFYLAGGCLFRKIKYVRTIHNTVLWTSWDSIGKVVERFFRKKRANVAISCSVQESYFERFSEKPPIINNGLEIPVPLPFSKLAPQKINILFAGRLEWQKGVDEMISVVSHFSEDERFMFYVIGSGSLKQRIEASIRSQRNVHIQDAVYNIASYLGSFDYLFMPSNHEGLGLLSIEASLSGTPPIINNCAGLNETLPKEWPLKVNENSIDDYIRIFEKIETFDRKELGMQAFDFVSQKYSASKMSNDYEVFYHNMRNRS